MKPATARGLLRNAGIEKDGKQYEWTKSQFADVVKKLSSKSSKDEKPAKKAAPAKKKSKKEDAEAA